MTVTAIVTDIEGTTSSIDFVHQVLFPYASRQLPEFVRQSEALPEVASLLDSVRAEADEPDADIERVIAILLRWIEDDRKVTALKSLQGLIWRHGYESGGFTGHMYDDAVAKLKTLGSSIEWGEDLGAEDETLFTKEYDRPVFVFDYPRSVKAFYMKSHPERDDLVKCSDLLAPEGYGEIIGGSQREDDLTLLQSHIAAQGLPEEAYHWYLDLRKFGSVPHSGFGLGLERTVAWICGLKHIREAVPFARTMARLYP